MKDGTEWKWKGRLHKKWSHEFLCDVFKFKIGDYVYIDPDAFQEMDLYSRPEMPGNVNRHVWEWYRLWRDHEESHHMARVVALPWTKDRGYTVMVQLVLTLKTVFPATSLLPKVALDLTGEYLETQLKKAEISDSAPPVILCPDVMLMFPFSIKRSKSDSIFRFIIGHAEVVEGSPEAGINFSQGFNYNLFQTETTRTTEPLFKKDIYQLTGIVRDNDTFHSVLEFGTDVSSQLLDPSSELAGWKIVCLFFFELGVPFISFLFLLLRGIL